MQRNYIIIHPSDMSQSDYVRCIFPIMQFMRKNDYNIIPSITQIPCYNKDILKKTKSVIIQRPTGRMEMVLKYESLKKECGFKLITDIDDLMWDLSPIIKSYAQSIQNYDEIINARLKRVLPCFDKIVCSTQYLVDRIKKDFHKTAILMPNAVSSSLFGIHKTSSSFSGKPKVMYAGNLGHYTEEDPGDFKGPWIPWLQENIENDTIEFYSFGKPHFLKKLENKYISIPYTNSMQFPSTVANYKPNFYLAPLANNNFNKAKSDLKFKEATILGSVFIGSNFEDSPYNYVHNNQLIDETDSVEILNKKFQTLCEPQNFMTAINYQYSLLQETPWLHEDKVFQEKFISSHT